MKKKAKPILAVGVLVIVIVLIGLLTSLVRKYTPSAEVMDSKEYFGLQSEEEVALVLNHEILEYKGRIEDDICYVDYEAVKECLNDKFFWDEEANLMLYTMPLDIIEIPAESREYTADGKTNSMKYDIVKLDGNKTYLALDFVKEYTALEYEFFTEPNRIVMNTQWGDVTVASIRKKGKVRTLGGIKSPILREVQKNEVVTILNQMEDWTEVMTQDGYIGYIQNKRLTEERTETLTTDFEEPEYSSITRDHGINLVWHQITSMESNYNIIYDIASVKGVNVISPTWYSITANDGSISSLALSDYVETAHQNDMEVWGLVDNFSENIDFTKVMKSTASRTKVENQLIASAIEYGLDGINIDFEVIPEEAVDGFIQFVREISVKCKKNNLVLSVDVPPPTYTQYYNRAALGEVCDYVIVMGYDEHYYGSEKAGSVASFSYEKDGLVDTMREVPVQKVISGIPFYTRLWNTKTNEDGTTTVTSEVMGMSEAEQMLINNDVEAVWDEETHQNYAEFEGDDGSLYQIWLEDKHSIEDKLSMVKDYGLPGVAFWKLGFEDSAIWDTIVKYVK
ncbi:MAG: glycosyl hydrolase family 18 protein [Muricoprocola sp.]